MWGESGRLKVLLPFRGTRGRFACTDGRIAPVYSVPKGEHMHLVRPDQATRSDVLLDVE